MNCQEAQLQLSGYLEKSLDAIRMKSVETHLSSCPFCRAELHALSDCIRQLADLPMLDVPRGFTQRVMAHAREIEVEPTAWQRLLAACKVTMPIQAAAMVLIGVLAVLLYQREDPRVRYMAFTEAPSELVSTPTLPLQAEEKTGLQVEDKQPVQPEPSRPGDAGRKNDALTSSPPPRSRAQSRQTAESIALKDAAPAPESPTVAKTEKAQENSLETARVATPRRRAIQAQEVSTGGATGRSSADALDMGAAIGALSRTPFPGAPYRTERALSPLSEPNADFEFVVRRRRPHERITQAQGASVNKPAEADVPASAPAAGEPSAADPSNIVEIRWFTVAPEHYEYFRKDLAAEASIESERSTAAKERDPAFKSSRELLIKVTIFQPAR